MPVDQPTMCVRRSVRRCLLSQAPEQLDCLRPAWWDVHVLIRFGVPCVLKLLVPGA